jgi:[ribosomal protein S18]-alanine N-acetyltransferase
MVKLFYMIRQFIETDLPRLLLIEEMAQISPWTEETFRQCFQLGAHYWVIEEQGQVVGFIIMMMQLGEGHILNVCVHPDAQHRGLGHQLVSHVLKIAKLKGIGIAFLEVRRSNLSAISLYKKLGFVEMGERKDYYATKKGREDAILYAKDLGVDETL